jgi:hypothetical protein
MEYNTNCQGEYSLRYKWNIYSPKWLINNILFYKKAKLEGKKKKWGVLAPTPSIWRIQRLVSAVFRLILSLQLYS